MASSINLTSLDFDTIKDNLKTYLKNQNQFKDYDFEASNMSVLLDVLSYNTHLNAMYLNMVGNEMFLDSSILRNSVLSHAKELNYLPRSFRSAYANVNIKIVTSDASVTNVTIPKGTSFTGKVSSRNYSFVTSENISVGGNLTFFANNVLIYEGNYITDSYIINDANPENYIMKNQRVDTSSITVDVIEDNGATPLVYNLASSLFNLDENSKNFFLQQNVDGKYEVVFGDGIIGRKPKDGSVISINYRVCNGEFPNGIRSFTADGSIIPSDTITVTVNAAAAGGSVSETIESIKFNAPRAFTTQERAVTAEDYSTLLKANFSEINDIIAYGGEETDPPQYGKVIISLDLQGSDKIPVSRKDAYYSFLKKRTPLSIDPIFKEPEYTYIRVDSNIKYNINTTTLSSNDIKSLAVSKILAYNDTYLDGFGKTLRNSKLITDIDASHTSVISNDTTFYMIKRLTPALGTLQNIDVDFGSQLRDDVPQLEDSHGQNDVSIIFSSTFTVDGVNAVIEDDGDGIIRLMAEENNRHTLLKEIGTVNYSTGQVKLSSFKVDSYPGNYIKLYARPLDKDITSSRNIILSIVNEDINITVNQVRV